MNLLGRVAGEGLFRLAEMVAGTADGLGILKTYITNTIPVTIAGVIDVDATGQGDVPVTLDGEEVEVTLNGEEVEVTLNSEAVILGAGAASIGKASDDGPGWTSVFGISGARFTSADATGAADLTDAPTAGQKIVLTDLVVSVDTAMRVDIQEETSGTYLLSFYMAANTTIQITPRTKMKLATADKKVRVDTSAAGNIAITPYYYSEA